MPAKANSHIVNSHIVFGGVLADYWASLLSWYGDHARELPWRHPPRSSAQSRPVIDPYPVLLSEIMLQQTTVATVTPYFQKFMDRWPTIYDLAKAEDAEVMAAWAGLGYYARARNLMKTVRHLARSGDFPESYAEWLRLPGIGPYTAAALAAITLDEPVAVVDGNIERVLIRLHDCAEPREEAKKRAREWAQQLTPDDRPGDYAQALMDLGQSHCKGRNPDCPLCPIAAFCRGSYRAQDLPLREKRSKKPQRSGYVLAYTREKAGRSELYLQRRPDHGLLSGTLSLPGSNWQDKSATAFSEPCPDDLPCHAERLGQVTHEFTHFTLHLSVYKASDKMPDKEEKGEWVAYAELPQAGLSSLMQKAARLLIQ